MNNIKGINEFRVTNSQSDYTQGIIDFVSDHFGRKLTLLDINEETNGSGDLILNYDSRRVLKLDSLMMSNSFDTFTHLKEHSDKLPIAKIYAVGKISIPIRLLSPQFVDRLRAKYRKMGKQKHSDDLIYILMEKVKTTDEVLKTLLAINGSQQRFNDYIGDDEKVMYPSALGRMGGWSRVGMKEKFDQFFEFVQQDEELKKFPKALEYSKRVAFILAELRKFGFDWLDIHAGQFGLNLNNELVAYDIDNYEGSERYPVKHHIKETKLMKHLKSFNESLFPEKRVEDYESRKLIVKIKPNTEGKTKWYYNDSNKHMIGKELTVMDYVDEPTFTSSYRYTDGLFISWDDCEVVKEISRD